MGRDPWEAAAERLNLSVDERTAFVARPKLLHGTVDGVDVTVRYRSSDDNTETRYHVVLPGSIPVRLIRPRWWEFIRRRRDAFGNRDWRRKFVVKAPDPVATDL